MPKWMGQVSYAPSGETPRGWRRRARVVVAVASWLCLLIVLGLWLLLGLADVWWPATFLMFSPRWLLALPPAMLAGVAALLRRRSLGVCFAAVVLAAGPLAGFVVPWQSLVSDAPSNTPVRVLTCNMHYRKADAIALDRLLDEARPDIVALQEWPGWQKSRVLSGGEWHVKERLPLFLASRFPIRRASELGADSMREEGAVARYELETPAGIVTFFSVHLASPRGGLYGVVHDGEGGVDDLDAGSVLRREQSENLVAEAEQVSGPLLLAGDFNTPTESDIFRRVWQGRYSDAFTEAGWGWGYTFHGGKTSVRIDHILAGPGWRCRHCWVGPNVGSPHRPVIADLVWTR